MSLQVTRDPSERPQIKILSSIQAVVDIPAGSQLKTGLYCFPVCPSHRLISPPKVTIAKNLPHFEKSRLEIFKFLPNSKCGMYFNMKEDSAACACSGARVVAYPSVFASVCTACAYYVLPFPHRLWCIGELARWKIWGSKLYFFWIVGGMIIVRRQHALSFSSAMNLVSSLCEVLTVFNFVGPNFIVVIVAAFTTAAEILRSWNTNSPLLSRNSSLSQRTKIIHPCHGFTRITYI